MEFRRVLFRSECSPSPAATGWAGLCPLWVNSSLALMLPVQALADTESTAVTMRMEWLLALLALLLTSLVLLRRRSRRMRTERQSEHSNELVEREERLTLSLWGSGDEFWDWDISRNELFRNGYRKGVV